jgi:hypothetical protein
MSHPWRATSLRLALYLLVFLALDFLGGKSVAVDIPLSPGLWLAIIGMFVLWLASLRACGLQLGKWAGVPDSPVGIHLALGSLLFAMLAWALASLGWLRPELRFFLYAFQAAALAWIPLAPFRFSARQALPWAPLTLLFALNLLDSFVIHPYWDPLHHHLVGARLFWENGRMYFPETAIAAYQEGGFELLFLWPHFYFAQAGGLGLLAVQIFAQLTHTVLGFGGSLLAAYALAKQWLPSPSWRALAVTLFALPASLQFAIPTAKNDWGIVLWIMAGLWLLGQLANRPAAAAGMLFGFAFLAKVSAGFTLVGLPLMFFLRRGTSRPFLLFIAGCCLGALPLAWRNWSATGDPLFPVLGNQFFEAAYGPAWRDALAQYIRSPLGLARAKELFGEYPLAPLAILTPLLAFSRRELLSLRAAAAAIGLGGLLYSFLAGEATELRLWGASLPLSALLVVVGAQRASERLRRPARVAGVLLVLLALYLPYRWDALARIPRIPEAHLQARRYISGEAQGWFRDHFQPGWRAALLVESRSYHSIPFPVVRPWDAPQLDSLLQGAGSAPEFIRRLRAAGFTHLILSQEKLDLFYPRALIELVEPFVLAQTSSHVFRSPHSVVADLRRIETPADFGTKK